jgi:(p)ppGpp synthase/HD superfamily hydrolase
MKAYSRALDRALEVAAGAHRDQVRKGGTIPYVVHPAHVAILLIKYGFPEEVVIAGALHDVVEDTDVTIDAIAEEFGNGVAVLVSQVTEQKFESAGGAARPWRARKEEQLRRLAQTPAVLAKNVAAVKAADALHNGETTLRDVRASGAAAWDRFRAPATEQLWYYESLASFVEGALGDHPLARELRQTVEALARAASAPGPG